VVRGGSWRVIDSDWRAVSCPEPGACGIVLAYEKSGRDHDGRRKLQVDTYLDLIIGANRAARAHFANRVLAADKDLIKRSAGRSADRRRASADGRREDR